MTGPVPAGLSRLPDVYVLNLRATRAGPGRIEASWDDPGDPAAGYQYRLRNETETWTVGLPIEDPATMLKRGEGVTVEWTLTGLPADADYDRIAIRVINATGSSTAEAPVTVPVVPVAPQPEGEESLFVPVLLTSAGRNNSLFSSELTLTNRGGRRPPCTTPTRPTGEAAAAGPPTPWPREARESNPTPSATSPASASPFPAPATASGP